MKIDNTVRDALRDLADEAPPGDGLATTALRGARRHRVRVRAAVTAGVAVVAAAAVPVGASVLSEPGNSDAADVLSPAGVPAQQGSEVEPAQEGPEVLPAPDSRLLADDELAEAFATCRADVDGEQLPGYEGWEPVFGITLDVDAPPFTPTTWIASSRGDDYRADCVLDASGAFVAGGGEYGGKSTPTLLYAVVDGQETRGAGRYVEPVATVTVQYEDGAEQEAVLQGGFWFHVPEPEFDDFDDPERMPDTDLIGVQPGYTYRGYDAAGELVYDSSVDGPSVEDCYADPSGTEFVGNHAGRTDPAECVVTHEWAPMS